MRREEDTFEIDLGKLVQYLVDRWWIILISSLIFASAAFGYTRFAMTPLYKASVTIYVNNINAPSQELQILTGSNLAAAERLVSTYVNIIKSDTVLKDVIKEGKLSCSVRSLRGMMSAEQVEETEMFRVNISHPQPKTAAYIANAVANVAPKRIASFVEGSSTKIIDYASVPIEPYSPNYEKNILLGLVIGAFLACVVMVLRYLFDIRVRSEDDLKQYFEAPVLGVIPSFSQSGKKKSDYTKGYGYGYRSQQPEKEGSK